MANEYNNKIVLSTGEVLIDLSQDDIKPEHVDSGIIFHDKTGAPKTGTSTKTVDASTATAEAAEVLAGRTFGKGNQLATGTMPDNSGTDVEITSTEPASIPKGFSDGSSKAKIAESELAKLIPSNIKQGVTILQVEGAYKPEDKTSKSKEVTPTFTEKTYNPAEDDCDFYSSVTVKAISVVRTDNEFGGVTVTIG